MPDRVNPLARGLADIDVPQSIQDAAFGSHSIALLPKRLEFLLECLQVTNALGHVLDVLVEDRVDGMAVLPRGILEEQKRADFIERHIERAAVPDEGEPFQVLALVKAVVSVTARRLLQQPLALIEADGS